MDTLWGVFENAQFGFAPALATALLHSLWQCAALAAMAAIAFQLLNRRSASLRHTVGMSFLLAMAMIPTAQFLQFWQQPATEVNNGLIPAMTVPNIAAGTDALVQESSDLAAVLSLLWMLGTITMLLRHLGGWWLIGRLQRRSFGPLPSEWQHRLEALRQKMRISRDVVAHVVERTLTPFTAGLLRPAIWIPRSLFARMPREQIEALLAHELAHIRRLDWLWNGLQCFIECLLFFHPAAWWLSRRIREEREHACDDLAVAACADAIALAEALTALAHDRRSLSRPLPRLLLAADGGSLMNRIARLLSAPPASGRWWAPVGLTALLATSALLAAQLDPSEKKTPLLRIESSTDGVLKPGDYRNISANGLDKQRDYRARVDAQGRIVEAYQENGVSRPIDAQVRAWVDEVSRLSVPSSASASRWAAEQAARNAEQAARDREQAVRDSEQALLRSEQALRDSGQAKRHSERAARDSEQALRDSERAVHDSEQAARDSKQAMRDTEQANKAIVRLVAAHPSVASKIGSPVTVYPPKFAGRWQVNDENGLYGQVRVSFTLAGPQGQVDILASAIAMRGDKQWKLTQLDVTGFVPKR